MSTATAPTTNEPETTLGARAPRGDVHDYRAVCSAAVTSFVIAVLGLSAFWLSGLLLISIVGLLLGIYAWLTIRRRQDELTGTPLALASIFLSMLTLIAAGGFHAYVYATEVPDGYERIGYRDLQIDPARGTIQIPESAQSLAGKKVFIKGYILDPSKATGIKSFFLVRDKGDCCFGGKPAIDQRIMVELDHQAISYTDRHSKIIGELSVAPETMVDAEGKRILYTLKGNFLE